MTKHYYGIAGLVVLIVLIVFVFYRNHFSNNEMAIPETTQETVESIISTGQLFTTASLNDHREERMLDGFDDDLIKGVIETDEIYNSPELIFDRKRNANVVNALNKESMEKSLKKLSDIGMFDRVGSLYRRSGLSVCKPLPEEYGESDIPIILSNRRFLKLYNELSGLSEAQASSLINSQLTNALLEYDSRCKEHRDRVNKYGSMSISLSNNPDGSPTLLGSRYELLSLLWLSGNLRLKNTRPVVEKVAEYAVKQRDTLYDVDEENLSGGIGLLMSVGIYNRQILITALIGTSSGSDIWSDESKWRNEKVTMYNAAFTSHDHLVNIGVLPADFRTGEQTIKVHVPLTDQEFEEIYSQHK